MGEEARIWIGGLPEGIKEDEIRDEYDRFGEIKNVQIRDNNAGTSFAFVQFSDRLDAEDAVKRTDQGKLFGMPFIKVSWSGKGSSSKGKGKATRSRSPRGRSDSRRRPPERLPPARNDSRSRPPSGRDRQNTPPWRDDRPRNNMRSRSPPPRGGKGGYGGKGRSPSPRRAPPRRQGSKSPERPSWWQPKPSEVQGNYRVKLENLPEDMGWQELKGLGGSLAKVGQCSFTRTNRDQTGVLEFTSSEDMRRAVDELDGRRFEGSRGRVKAYEEKAAPRR